MIRLDLYICLHMYNITLIYNKIRFKKKKKKSQNTSLHISMPTLNTWPSKEGLRIGYLNINHALNKLNDIFSILENSGKYFHVFCLSESRLSDRILDSDIAIPGYSILRLDPKASLDTGLLVYYDQSIIMKRKSNLEQFGVESVWIEIKTSY